MGKIESYGGDDNGAKKQPERKPQTDQGDGSATNETGTERGTANTDSGTGTSETGRTKTGRNKTSKKTEVVDGTILEIAEPPKPKSGTKTNRGRKKPVKSDDFITCDQITNLLTTVSSILACKGDFAVFALTEEESKQLAAPLYNIIKKSDIFSKIGDHGDAIALISACMIIFTPKIMLFLSYKKSKKKGVIKNADRGTNKEPKPGLDQGKVNRDNEGFSRSNSTNPPVGHALDALEAITGGYY